MSTYSHEDWFEAERLHRAAAEGEINEIERLISLGFDVNLFDDMGYTALHHAVSSGRYDAAKSLFLHGASVNANDDALIGETPLALAVQTDHIHVIELLIQSGADPDITGWMGLTARDRAAERKDRIGKEIDRLLADCRKTY